MNFLLEVLKINLKNLSEIEKETYDFIKDVGEILTKNLPNRRMPGVIPSLKNKGLVEVYKKYTSSFRRKTGQIGPGCLKSSQQRSRVNVTSLQSGERTCSRTVDGSLPANVRGRGAFSRYLVAFPQ